MRPRIIENMDDWKILKAALKEKGYRSWQYQYGVHLEEGYQARFTNNEKSVLVITHNPEIQKDIDF